MKAVFISFNQAHYEEVIDTLDKLLLRGFTSWELVQGRGSNTGEPHLGSHAWPTLNSALITMVPDEKVDRLMALLKEIDDDAQMQGLRAFVWNIEGTI